MDPLTPKPTLILSAPVTALTDVVLSVAGKPIMRLSSLAVGDRIEVLVSPAVAEWKEGDASYNTSSTIEILDEWVEE